MNIQDRIIPVPQQLELHKGASADLTVGYRITAENITGTLAQNAVKRLEEELKKQLGVQSDSGVTLTLTMA